MTDNIFERIKNEANIVEVIGKRISLKKKGGEWVGLCPFHDDHTPSMFVSARKQLYKCFSCGAGGDVIKFVMEYDKLPLKDAVKAIADLYNLVLPQTFSFRQAEKIDRFLDMKTLNAWAADIYHDYLFKAKRGKPGRDYLKTRGLSREALEVFKIGYTPDQEDGFLIKCLSEDERVKNTPWQKSSLFTSGGWGYRDFFRNRILFPIRNEKNEVVGFGGRTVGEDTPKYLNVRESPWFHKRETLYGLKESYARIIKSKQVYVVEGYLDVIACYEFGIPAVAPLGTALTREQLLKLKRYTEKVHLFFDGDESGKKAAWRSAQDMVSLSLDGSVLILPAGVDPFDFVKKNPPEQVKDFLATQGVNVYRYLVAEASRHQGDWSPVEKKLGLDKLLPVYNSISDPVVKKHFGEMIGEVFSLDWEKFTEENSRNRPPISSPRIKQPVQGNLIKKERSFILFLCNHPRFLSSARPVISPENLEDGLSQYMYRKLLSLTGEITFAEILTAFREDGQEKVAEYISTQSMKKDFQTARQQDETRTGREEIPPGEHNREIETDFNRRLGILKLEYLEKKKTQLQVQIQAVQKENNGEEEGDLYEAYTALQLEKHNLKQYLEKI